MTMATTTTISGIYFDDGGSGSQPIIFLHSLAGNTNQWSAQLNHLRSTHRAIAIDLRGHGRSSSDEDFSIESMAQDVLEVVNQLGIERFILAGHSMGGSVAIAYAGAHPDRLAGLLLVDPSGDSTQMPVEEIQGYLGALESDAYVPMIEGYWQQILEGSTSETQEIVMTDLRNTAKDTVVGVSKALFNYNPVPHLISYDGPKFSMITRFNQTPVSLHNLVPDLPHQLLSGTSHWLQMDKPQEFNELLDNWLASLTT